MEFGYSSSYASTLFIDNKSSIKVSKNPEYHRHIKHLDLQHYWLREAVQDSLINPVYVLSCQNVADLFTKAVQPQVSELKIIDLTYFYLYFLFSFIFLFWDLRLEVV